MESDHPNFIDEKTIEVAENYRQRKSTSVLTIVFTDIVNSTALREELGEREYERIREDHDRFMALKIEEGDAGVIVKSTGDGVLAVFSEPSTAVEKLLQIQRKMVHHPCFKLRIGIDMGQVTVKSKNEIIGDVFGRQVNRCARIQALSESGHILTSFTVFDCAVGWLKGLGVEWENHGLATLKGFTNPISIHEAYEPDLIKPQSNNAFPQPKAVDYGNIQYCMASGKWEYSKIDYHEWTQLFKSTYSDLSVIDPIESTISNTNTIDYIENIRNSVISLTHNIPVQVKALWISDYPDNNLSECQLLEEAGMVIDFAISPEEAISFTQQNEYLFIVTDIKLGNDRRAGINLLSYLKEQHYGSPAIVYTSVGDANYFNEEAMDAGAVLCTAGFINLFNGIDRVLHWFVSQLPGEWIPEAYQEPSRNPSFLRRLFKKIC